MSKYKHEVTNNKSDEVCFPEEFKASIEISNILYQF
jgi:hypothetical protein